LRKFLYLSEYGPNHDPEWPANNQIKRIPTNAGQFPEFK
jgi:hypothetical protein